MQILDLLAHVQPQLDKYASAQTINIKPVQNLPQFGMPGRQDMDTVVQYICYYLQHSVNTSHPNFANRMWSGANTPAILGEIITAITNTSACTYESAPVATQMEQYLVREMLHLVGFTDGEGQMTTGSSNANMIAMMIARNKHITNCKQFGMYNTRKLVAFVSADAHYSLDKAANILGIGTNNLIKIQTNDVCGMSMSDLEQKIIEQKHMGNVPFFVCATLGTTVRGGYDDIIKLLALQKKYHFFLHGDGAWGGAAIMSDSLRHKFLSGVEFLDSFTMDFHKMMGTSLVCNVLLINHSNNQLKDTCNSGDTSYVFRKESDLGVKSLQCGRKVDSLKWFLDWQFYGKSGFAVRVEKYRSLILYAQELVENNPKLAIVSKAHSFNLCFRIIGSNTENQVIREKLQAENKALLSLAYIDNVLVFRLLVTNQNTTKKSLKTLISTITEAN